MQAIFTGALWEKKGIYQLAKAWNAVTREVPGAKLAIYGRGREELVKEYLEEETKNSVAFYGYIKREELYQRLATATVAVFPSYAECFALAPLEAMACGKPVIAVNRGALKDTITHGVDGFLVEEDDVRGLTECLIKLLSNRELCQRMGTAAREKVLAKFTERRRFDATSEAYTRAAVAR